MKLCKIIIGNEISAERTFYNFSRNVIEINNWINYYDFKRNFVHSWRVLVPRHRSEKLNHAVAAVEKKFT